MEREPITHELIDRLVESDTLKLQDVADELLASGEAMAEAIRYANLGKDPSRYVLNSALAAWEARLRGE